MPGSVIIAGVRTPIGRVAGSLRDHSVVGLGALAIAAAVRAAGIDGGDVDAVVMGSAVQAGAGPNPARQAAAGAGIPMDVPATTINKLCLSGLTAVAFADQLISTGQHDIVVAGGMESMTNAPHLILSPRRRADDGQAMDALDHDALRCAFDGEPVGIATERYQTQFGIPRGQQDEFAALSHARASAAGKAGLLAEEIVPVITAPFSGRPPVEYVEYDEGVWPSPLAEGPSAARSALPQHGEGVLRGDFAAQPSDGGCAMVLMSRERASRRGLNWLAEIGAYGVTAGTDPSLFGQPAAATRDALRRAGGLTVGDIDLFEINEAFAGVVIASMRDLGLTSERVNVNGGGIALGHPIGMTGARMILTLALELRRRGGGMGVAALSGGGGQGDAVLLRAPGMPVHTRPESRGPC
ncbi:acetyl-CoA C-acyltransferase [Streptomyces sp. NPDC020845]|uniref:acetyl-CoA C-acyltransferase n=1 Tax=Streptomyces sp. NPDC020845 TaxID=3365096 RepID=UPI003797094B